ncbi:MAG TPA: thiamine pyrophosphate-binding protein, partial [Blastococcus sp.]
MSEPTAPPVRTDTVRLTVSQAVVRFLAGQHTERDGHRRRLFAGCFGIFGHGNVAGLGQALLQAEIADPELLPYVLGRNEQAMVHTAAAYARARDRLQTWAVSSSVGPGATNMVTGAALATINRLPVLLLPADTLRLTVAQAVVRFLPQQYTERDGQRQRLFAGCFGIFGHGNVAGLGQALLQAELEDGDSPERRLPYVLGRNEQAMVHTAAAYARAKDRLQTWAVSASVGPGATNMVTGAALATINRLPVLLLPADTFATRASAPVLQELERPDSGDVTVNDCFRPVSRYFDRVWRPEQLPGALLGAMRVLTDPAETGAVTLCFPQDVQAEAFDWPVELFAERTWHVARP